MRFLFAALPLIFCSCSTSYKPCANGGDVLWKNADKPVTGDRVCYKKTLRDGRVVNHGNYKQFYSDGKLAVEGRFNDGKRDGVWSQYDEKGEKIMERYYERGVEKPR